MGRASLRTSREIYQQLRWDPRLDTRRVVVGVETASTRAVLLDEWRRAAAQVRAIRAGALPWAALFEPIDPLAGAADAVLVEIAAPDPGALAALEGWLIGHATRLLLALEREPGARWRPVPGLRALIGAPPARGLVIARASPIELGRPRRELPTGDLRAAFEAWTERPDNATLTISAAPRAAVLARLAGDGPA